MLSSVYVSIVDGIGSHQDRPGSTTKNRRRGRRKDAKTKRRKDARLARQRNAEARLRGLWANGMQASGGDGGKLPSRRGRSIGISIFMGLSRLRATVPRGT